MCNFSHRASNTEMAITEKATKIIKEKFKKYLYKGWFIFFNIHWVPYYHISLTLKELRIQRLRNCSSLKEFKRHWGTKIQGWVIIIKNGYYISNTYYVSGPALRTLHTLSLFILTLTLSFVLQGKKLRLRKIR